MSSRILQVCFKCLRIANFIEKCNKNFYWTSSKIFIGRLGELLYWTFPRAEDLAECRLLFIFYGSNDTYYIAIFSWHTFSITQEYYLKWGYDHNNEIEFLYIFIPSIIIKRKRYPNRNLTPCSLEGPWHYDDSEMEHPNQHRYLTNSPL